MRILFELLFALTILFLFISILYSVDVRVEDEYLTKSLIYEIFNTFDLEIRHYAFLNLPNEIKTIIKSNIPKNYDVFILICSEKKYEDCFKNVNLSSSEIFSVSYFVSWNFTYFENLEIVAYVWKII